MKCLNSCIFSPYASVLYEVRYRHGRTDQKKEKMICTIVVMYFFMYIKWSEPEKIDSFEVYRKVVKSFRGLWVM